jgi:hypothetical protein
LASNQAITHLDRRLEKQQAKTKKVGGEQMDKMGKKKRSYYDSSASLFSLSKGSSFLGPESNGQKRGERRSEFVHLSAPGVLLIATYRNELT